MSFQFIIGSSGSGKSYYLRKKLLESAAKFPKKNHFLIVPEQFTLSSQKALVEMHPGHSVMDIDILNFERFAFRIFRQLGTDTKKVLEETGKNLIIRGIMQDNRDRLKILGSKAESFGYVNEVKSLISELSQYGVSAGDLKELPKDSMKALLSGKLEDIELIYSEFNKAIKDEYITSEMLLELLSTVIDDSPLVRDCVIAFDGFTGFTPLQELVLERLFKYAGSCYFSVTLDPVELEFIDTSEEDLFYMSKTYIKSVRTLAKTAAVKEEAPVILEDTGHRFIENGALSFLEKNIFRSPKSTDMGFKDGEDIRIISALTSREELLSVASMIRGYVLKGAHYREMAIITADMEKYKTDIMEVFSEYNIPVFVDSTWTISHHPLISFVDALLELFISDFSHRGVMGYLRCYMSPMEIGDIDLLDNYLLATGIRGQKAYEKAFRYRPKGMDVKDINRIRAAFMESLKDVIAVFSKDSLEAKEILKALYDAVIAFGLDQRMNTDEDRDIYNSVMELFDKIDTFMSQRTLSLRDFKELFNAGVGALKKKVLPECSDMVLFGDIRRSRLEDIKTLFVIGANDGMLPAIPGSFGLLSERERQSLEDLGISLSPLSHRRVFDENFYIYLALSRPSRNLIITYAITDDEGKEILPSSIVSTLQDMFTALRVEPARPLVDTYHQAKRRLYTILGEYFYGENPHGLEALETKNLLSILLEREPDFIEKIYEAFKEKRQEDLLSKEVLAAINKDLSTSVSQIESYARCAYAYFLNYILRLSEKTVVELSTLDMGNIYHEVLEKFFALAKSKKEDVCTFDEDKRNAYVREALEEVLQNVEEVADYSSATSNYLKYRIQTTMETTVWALIEQIKKGGFRPEYFEVELKSLAKKEDLKLELENGVGVDIKGKIDRLDVARTDGGVYIKIIDYKSGDKTINYSLLHAGIQVQLLFYLDRIKQGMDAVPAAAFYYFIDEPLVEVTNLDIDDVSANIKKELRPNGLMAGTTEVFDLMDREINEAVATTSSYKSDVVNVDVFKTSGLKSAQAIDPDDLLLLMDYSYEKTKELATMISKGQMKRNPYRLSGNTPCNNCKYKALCSGHLKESNYKDIREIKSLEEFKEVINEAD